MCLIFSFDFWRDRSFREMTDMFVIDMVAVAEWRTLTRIVHEYRVHGYICAGTRVHEYRVHGYRCTGYIVQGA